MAMAKSADTKTGRQMGRFAGRSLAGLLAVAGAGVGLGLLLLLVRASWSPLLQLDRWAADGLNEQIAPHPILVAFMNAITSLGSRTILIWLIAVVVIGLVIRKRRRLAVYLLVTAVGFLLLDPAMKAIVGRLRPVVETPIAASAGNSFPSGHSLGSFVTYGALLLVFLPAMSQRQRRIAAAAVAVLVVAIGFSRWASISSLTWSAPGCSAPPGWASRGTRSGCGSASRGNGPRRCAKGSIPPPDKTSSPRPLRKPCCPGRSYRPPRFSPVGC